MNERINKLKQQAVAYVDSVNDGLTTEHYRQIVDLKFAELIVRECANIAFNGGDKVTSAVIQMHFGVEE